MTIPTIAEIEAQLITSIEGKIGQTIPSFARAFFRVLAKAVAGVMSLTYRFAAWCLDQTQPATANEFWLTIWGDRYGVVRDPSVAARIDLTATGVDGSPLPAGTLWQSSGGLIYSQEASGVVGSGYPSGTVGVIVACLTRGDSGNLGPGATLTLVSPVTGIDSAATTGATETDGEDQQTLEAYRAEIINRIRYRPQGGAIPDYVIWAREVPGVVAAFVTGGGGTVTVYPLVNITGFADDGITPVPRVADAPKIAEVDAYLEDPIRKPIGVNVVTLAATERTCAVTITTATIAGGALSADQKQSVQDAVTTALYAAYPRQYPDQVDPTDTVSVALVWDALLAIGATAASITINISGIGGGPYVLPIGEIIKISGAITWA